MPRAHSSQHLGVEIGPLGSGVMKLRVRVKRLLTVLGTLVPLLVLSACVSAPPLGNTSADLPGYGLISPEEAVLVLHAMSDQPDFVLLDIRMAPEVATGHIPGTDALDYYSPSFHDNLAELDQDVTYLIYCRTGRRTAQTRAEMMDLGFERVFELAGGIRAWESLGYPVCVGSLDSECVCSGELPY